MKLAYSRGMNCAYIFVKEKLSRGEIKRRVPLNDFIYLHFSKNMQLLGIEILDAEKYLPYELLEKNQCA